MEEIEYFIHDLPSGNSCFLRCIEIIGRDHHILRDSRSSCFFICYEIPILGIFSPQNVPLQRCNHQCSFLTMQVPLFSQNNPVFPYDGSFSLLKSFFCLRFLLRFLKYFYAKLLLDTHNAKYAMLMSLLESTPRTSNHTILMGKLIQLGALVKLAKTRNILCRTRQGKRPPG